MLEFWSEVHHGLARPDYAPDADKISRLIAGEMFPKSDAMPQRVAEVREIVQRCIEARNQIEAASVSL